MDQIWKPGIVNTHPNHTQVCGNHGTAENSYSKTSAGTPPLHNGNSQN